MPQAMGQEATPTSVTPEALSFEAALEELERIVKFGDPTRPTMKAR